MFILGFLLGGLDICTVQYNVPFSIGMIVAARKVLWVDVYVVCECSTEEVTPFKKFSMEGSWRVFQRGKINIII